VQLLHKLSIRSINGPEKLLKVIKNPITDYLPIKCTKIGFSYSASKCVRLCDYLPTLPQNQPIIVVIGAMAHGKVETDWVDDEIAISEYPLSGSVACGKLCCALEDLWNVK
jgi:rRNA small subunit pseudouridine methyltransferase Nep1